MNRERLIAMGIDYDAGASRFGGKVPMYEKYLKQFTEDINFPKLVNEMQANAYESAVQTAHALKGVVGTLSIMHLYELLCGLVEALREQRLEDAQVCFQEAVDEYNTVVCGLKEILDV